MTKVWVIALNTFKGAVRDRVLYSIGVFAVLIIASSLVAQEITIGDQFKVVRGVAQSAISVFLSVIAMFYGTSLIWRELDRRTIYNVLSKPVSRSSFVLGKFFGLVMTLWLLIAVMGALYLLFVAPQQGFPHTSFFVFLALLALELALLTAWATLFSTASSQTTAAAFTLAVFVIGHLADDIWLFGQGAETAWIKTVSAVTYWVLPNFEVFNVQPQAAHQVAVDTGFLVHAVLYGLAYTTAVLVVAVRVFSRRDFK